LLAQQGGPEGASEAAKSRLPRLRHILCAVAGKLLLNPRLRQLCLRGSETAQGCVLLKVQGAQLEGERRYRVLQLLHCGTPDATR
jgi:hypothetical protein